jgi:hypothetical protein
MTLVDYVEPRATLPVPKGRGRWRLVAYQRQFSTAFPVAVAQLDGARGRRLTTKLNAPAEFTFTLDGRDPAASSVLELATDVIAYRWHEPYGRDWPMFRGVIDHSEDQLSESSAVVTFTAHDYFGMLTRRIMATAAPVVWTQYDQDTLVSLLMVYATSSGSSFAPGNYLPLSVLRRNPDGTTRAAPSGQLRDRTYQPGQVIGNAIDDLAHVINGFDYAVAANGPSSSADYLNIYYPQQGVTRTDVALVYGVNVSTLTRTVSSNDYANYVRVIGNKGSADPNAAQLYSDRWNTDANNVTVNPVGLWQMVENASDVSVQSTLDDKAAGDLGWNGLLTPTYTLGLRPGAYVLGYLNMGDTVPLYVNEGRLAVNTSVRVVGVDFDIGDDGQEDIKVTVGRPPLTLAKVLTRADRDIDALARR